MAPLCVSFASLAQEKTETPAERTQIFLDIIGGLSLPTGDYKSTDLDDTEGYSGFAMPGGFGEISVSYQLVGKNWGPLIAARFNTNTIDNDAVEDFLGYGKVPQRSSYQTTSVTIGAFFEQLVLQKFPVQFKGSAGVARTTFPELHADFETSMALPDQVALDIDADAASAFYFSIGTGSYLRLGDKCRLRGSIDYTFTKPRFQATYRRTMTDGEIVRNHTYHATISTITIGLGMSYRIK